MSFLSKRAKSFKYAFNGVYTLLKTQTNAKIHFFLALIAVALGFYLSISVTEWIAIVISISMVITAEALNTSIEFLGDSVTLEENESIKKAKDIGAAAVLLVSVGALFVGAIIFIPRILEF